MFHESIFPFANHLFTSTSDGCCVLPNSTFDTNLMEPFPIHPSSPPIILHSPYASQHIYESTNSLHPSAGPTPSFPFRKSS